MARIKVGLNIIALFFIPAVVALGEESPFQKSDFLGYINGDGSSIEEAVILKSQSDYAHCHDQECIKEEFEKNVNQEYEFVTKKFGVTGKDWEVSGESGLEVDIEQNDKFYDKLAIRLFSTGEEKVLYFDITDLIIELDKYTQVR